VSWLEFSSDSIGVKDRTYGVAKYPIRKQWALSLSTPGCLEIAAYFRSEAHAREFADVFGLTITDYRDH
jgi:hypothetical protein